MLVLNSLKPKSCVMDASPLTLLALRSC